MSRRFELGVAPRQKLTRGARVLVKAERALLRWLGEREMLCQLLLRRRRAEIERGLDPDTALILELAALLQTGTPGKASPVVERRNLQASIAVADALPDLPIRTSEQRVPGADGMLAARLYEPTGLGEVAPGLLFIHGGGWVTGDLDTHDGFCRRLAGHGQMRVLAIEPRLAPEHPFPNAADDVVAAFRHVATNASKYGIDPTRLAVGGDSAGGNLSAVVGLDTRADAIRPALMVLLYPALDGTTSMPSIKRNGKGYMLTEESIAWYLSQYIGQDDTLRTHPRVAPLHAPDVKGAPPALIVAAGFDPLVDEAIAFADRLKSAGERVELVTYAGLIHGFLLMTSISRASKTAADEIARRVGEFLS